MRPSICHNTQIQIQIHKYKLKLLIFVRPISCLSVTTTDGSQSIQLLTPQVNTTVYYSHCSRRDIPTHLYQALIANVNQLK